MDFITFSLIIDDIVFPDGRTVMGILGGGGPQTAFGLRLWAERVGLCAGVGADFPPAAASWLAQIGIDTAGLRRSAQWPTIRAWQVLEADGRRTQVWRVPGPAIGAQLGRGVDKLPPAYRQARAFHLGVHPESPDLDFIRDLRAQGAMVSVEPFRGPTRPLSGAELRALVSAGDVFSPNEAEARQLVGEGDALTLAYRLAEAGAAVVALRLGDAGALVQRRDTGETWRIPAAAVPVIDPTGAGNAFCGGFLAGWVQSGDIRLAGLYGVVAASFLVEQVGLPPAASIHAFRVEAQRRLRLLENDAVEEVSAPSAHLGDGPIDF
jgi:sugar/nucleoside kinase (ribokinase family)